MVMAETTTPDWFRSARRSSDVWFVSTILINLRRLLSLSYLSAPHPGSIWTVLMTVKILDNVKNCWDRDFRISSFGIVLSFDNTIFDTLRQPSYLCHCEKKLEMIRSFLCSKIIIHWLIWVMWTLETGKKNYFVWGTCAVMWQTYALCLHFLLFFFQ